MGRAMFLFKLFLYSCPYNWILFPLPARDTNGDGDPYQQLNAKQSPAKQCVFIGVRIYSIALGLVEIIHKRNKLATDFLP